VMRLSKELQRGAITQSNKIIVDLTTKRILKGFNHSAQGWRSEPKMRNAYPGTNAIKPLNPERVESSRRLYIVEPLAK
jgi:hypothetical protein